MTERYVLTCHGGVSLFINKFLNVFLALQVKAKNQLRVNGLGYYMYFGSFYAVLLIQLIILYVAILVISQVNKKSSNLSGLIKTLSKSLFFRHLICMP